MKIAWGITGCGHLLKENLELISRLSQVDIFVSRAAEEVMKIYQIETQNLAAPGLDLYRERSYSSPLIGRFYHGHYDLLVIAPATSNSVAKFVAGISDSLITNLFAQAGKCRVPIVVLPSDWEEEMVSAGPKGPVQVFPRPVDLENTSRLAGFPGVTVVKGLEELEECLTPYL